MAVILMSDRQFVPALLTEMRGRRGMTIKALAMASGMSYNYAQLLERGVHTPSELYLAKLARGLQCDIADLTRPHVDTALAG